VLHIYIYIYIYIYDISRLRVKDSAHVQSLVLNEHGLVSTEPYIILLPPERFHKSSPSVSFFGKNK